MDDLNYLSVGIGKDGDWDFGVLSAVDELSYEQMRGLREMTIVAIGTMEQMWRTAQEKKNPAYENKTPPKE